MAHLTTFTGSNCFGQTTSAATPVQIHLSDSLDHQDNHISQGQYLNDVLNGASPVDIVDHGISPFEDKTIHFQPSGFGVVCILNIPYNVTKSEIEHFLGRNASLIAHNEQGCSIHVIMERPTSKTMDCFVELLTPEAAVEAYNKHENLVMSGKHPRIGTRHVDVVTSNQDGLLRAIFPRARGLVWENGVPHKIENHDPYSAGFQGFFTREEMIGMYRHAETPQRSPFSVKCLQRTFECMISTLYKFPWHAQHMYTLEDRAQLFDCYMKQLGVLTYKVSEAQTVGLDTKLLIDFVSAGLNCAGFGERMRYMIASHSGQVGASFPINRKSAAWPFDVLSVPFVASDGRRWWFEHAATLDLLMYIIDLGANALGSSYVHSQWITTLPYSAPSDYDTEPIKSIRFKFREDVFNVSYDEIVSRETEVMRQLLTVGFARWKENIQTAWKKGHLNEEMMQDVQCLADLQRWDTNVVEPEPDESPRGTPMKEENGYAEAHESPNIYQKASTPRGIDPTVDPFEPFARRNSEPPMSMSETTTAPIRSESVRDFSTFDPTASTPHRTPGRKSAALEIRHPDGSPAKSPGTIGGHRSSLNVGRSPMRPRHPRGTVSVDQTIHEVDEGDGEEEEILMAGGRPRRATNAAF